MAVKRLLLLLLLLAPALAISPHVESLSTVLAWADWVAEARVVELTEIHDEGADGVRLKVQLTRAIYGQPPSSPALLYYLEGWPATMPDGKVEAPIWTGSSLERQLSVGDTFLAIGKRESCLSRAEPLSAEPKIREILGCPPSP